MIRLNNEYLIYYHRKFTDIATSLFTTFHMLNDNEAINSQRFVMTFSFLQHGRQDFHDQSHSIWERIFDISLE